MYKLLENHNISQMPQYTIEKLNNPTPIRDIIHNLKQSLKNIPSPSGFSSEFHQRFK